MVPLQQRHRAQVRYAPWCEQCQGLHRQEDASLCPSGDLAALGRAEEDNRVHGVKQVDCGLQSEDRHEEVDLAS